MRSVFTLCLFLCFGLIYTEAQAQEVSIVASEEAVRSSRTPTMAVEESSLPVINKPQVESKTVAIPTKKRGKKGATSAAAQTPTAPVTPTAPPPMVMGDVQLTEEILEQPIATTGNPFYDEAVKQSAARHGVDPNLVMAVMRQESGFNPRARSYKGASGLMQLMPATARRFGVNNIFDPTENIEAGTRYLRFLLDKFNGDVKLALAGYNAGEGAVVNYGYTVPPYRETQHYVRTISAKYGATKHRNPNRKSATMAAAKAPDAMTFSTASSTRLSNNY